VAHFQQAFVAELWAANCPVYDVEPKSRDQEGGYASDHSGSSLTTFLIAMPERSAQN
jgi:hypothetical protein